MSYNRVLHSGAKQQAADCSIRVSLSGYDMEHKRPDPKAHTAGFHLGIRVIFVMRQSVS